MSQRQRTLRTLAGPLKTVARLKLAMRLLRLKVQLIDDRWLTLPAADAPWDDVRRKSELQRRQDRLRKLHPERLWAEPLHWTARLVTLWR